MSTRKPIVVLKTEMILLLHHLETFCSVRRRLPRFRLTEFLSSGTFVSRRFPQLLQPITLPISSSFVDCLHFHYMHSLYRSSSSMTRCLFSCRLPRHIRYRQVAEWRVTQIWSDRLGCRVAFCFPSNISKGSDDKSIRPSETCPTSAAFNQLQPSGQSPRSFIGRLNWCATAPL